MSKKLRLERSSLQGALMDTEYDAAARFYGFREKSER